MKQHQVSTGKGRGIFLATNAFVGAALLAGLIMMAPAQAAIHLTDTDGDGVPDSQDNCINEANAPQRDTDNDSFGNRCDPDFNNDNTVNGADLAYFKTKFFGNDPDADLNGDSVVNGGDLAIFKQFFFKVPGPSGKSVPVAIDDFDLTNEDTAVSIDVVMNDTDVDGMIDPATVVITTLPGNGNAVANVDGTVTYTPDTGFLGPNTDTFQYTVNDNEGLTSNIATVTVTINALPVPVAGCSTTPQASVLNGGALTATDAETPANMLTYSLISDGSNGTVSLSSDGSFTYTPTPGNAGARGTDTFTFQVDDTDGGFSIGTETVIIDQTVMFLGDSITRGTIVGTPNSPSDPFKVGYRKPIFDSLSANGYSFDFVGSDALTGNDPSLQPFDSDNEGHGGWSDQELTWGRAGGYPADGIRAWLDLNPADYILLHAGTNGFHTQSNHIEELLDQIDVWENDPGGNPVTVILARMIDRSVTFPNVTIFNDNVIAMAQDRISNIANAAYPDNIIIVNQQSALWDTNSLPDPTLYGDALHPNTSGYSKMKDVWLYPLSGAGVQTGTGTGDSTGAYTGSGVLEKCP